MPLSQAVPHIATAAPVVAMRLPAPLIAALRALAGDLPLIDPAAKASIAEAHRRACALGIAQLQIAVRDAQARAVREGRAAKVRALSAGARALAAWLKRTGTSQRRLAFLAALGKSAVPPYLTGERTPTLSARLAIERVTGGEVHADSWARP